MHFLFLRQKTVRMDFIVSDDSSDGPNDRAFHIDEQECETAFDPSIPPTSGNEYLMRVRYCVYYVSAKIEKLFYNSSKNQ